MGQTISIGKQYFVSLRENHYFYVDKTDFIRQWWENADDITLITRPRRFGKTLNMSMLYSFFFRQYAGRGDLFEGLSIWEKERYRSLQGSYPVIFVSFNVYMNDVALATFSSFDSGKIASERTQPERFYHGFVLGLLVEVRDRYSVRSNRESGFGRYDVMLIPKNEKDNAVIMEFKVHDPDSEKTLEDTVKSALDQIREKKYDAELQEQGISQERIRHYGFAFEGKKVLIGA